MTVEKALKTEVAGPLQSTNLSRAPYYIYLLTAIT